MENSLLKLIAKYIKCPPSGTPVGSHWPTNAKNTKICSSVVRINTAVPSNQQW